MWLRSAEQIVLPHFANIEALTGAKSFRKRRAERQHSCDAIKEESITHCGIARLTTGRDVPDYPLGPCILSRLGPRTEIDSVEVKIRRTL